MLNGNRDRRRRRVFDMSLEMLLLFALLLGCLSMAAAQGGTDKSRETPATVTVVAPSRALPGDLAEREIRVEELEPLGFRELVGRIADLAGIEAVIEERPGRVAGGVVVHRRPVPFGLAMTGTVPAVLDELARLSGYDWTWSNGRLVFFRYGDTEQRRAERLPRGVAVGLLAAVAEKETKSGAARVDEAAESGEAAHAEVAAEGRLASGVPGEVAGGPGGVADPGAVAAVEGQGEASEKVAVPQEPAGWEVEPARHGTVEGVLRAWAERAGWNLAWETERQFAVSAAAVFEGGETEEEGFLAAADELLSDRADAQDVLSGDSVSRTGGSLCGTSGATVQ